MRIGSARAHLRPSRDETALLWFSGHISRGATEAPGDEAGLRALCVPAEDASPLDVTVDPWRAAKPSLIASRNWQGLLQHRFSRS